MAAYLLETGTTDRYLLEDGSGIYEKEIAELVFTDVFTVGADANIDAYPSGAPDYTYNDGSGANLTVNAANDRVQCSVGGDASARVIRSGTTTGDQEIRLDGFSTTDAAPEVMVRMATSGELHSFYYLYVNGNIVEIYRRDNSTSETLVASGDRGIAVNGRQAYRIKATGTNPVVVEGQVADTAVVTYSDTSASRKTVGPYGIGVYNGTANTAWVDNVEGYDLTVATGGATAAGVTLTATASLIAGAAAADSTAAGVTLTATGSLIAGAAAASSTAAGVTLPATASVIAGAASAASTAAGVTLPATASLVTGAAAASSTAAGVTLMATASFIPGSASSAADATAAGVTLTSTASLITGAVQAASNASGVTLTSTASLLPGAAQAASVASGITLTAAASLLPGTVQAASTAPAATLVATASLIPGAASAGVSATASGVLLSVVASLVPGTAVGEIMVPVTQPAGEPRRYRIRGRTYRFTDHELTRHLDRLLRHEPRPLGDEEGARRALEGTEKSARERELARLAAERARGTEGATDSSAEGAPDLPLVPAFDSLWREFMQARQLEAAAMLERLAIEMQLEAERMIEFRILAQLEYARMLEEEDLWLLLTAA